MKDVLGDNNKNHFIDSDKLHKFKGSLNFNQSKGLNLNVNNHDTSPTKYDRSINNYADLGYDGTVELYFKPKGLNSYNPKCVFGNYYSSSNKTTISVFYSPTDKKILVKVYLSNKYDYNLPLTNNPVLNENQLVHVIVTLNSGYFNVFINGKKCLENYFTDLSSTNGLSKLPTYLTYSECIVQHRIFDLPLTDNECIELWNNGRPDKYKLDYYWYKNKNNDKLIYNDLSSSDTIIRNYSNNYHIKNGFRFLKENLNFYWFSLSLIGTNFNFKTNQKFSISLNYRSNKNVYVSNNGYHNQRITPLTNNNFLPVNTLYAKNVIGFYNYLHNSNLEGTFSEPTIGIIGPVIGDWLEISDVKIKHVGVIAEYLPENITDKYWFDTSGLGNHLECSIFNDRNKPIVITDNIVEDIISVTSAPSFKPDFIGQLAIIEGDKVYIGTNTNSSSDWSVITK